MAIVPQAQAPLKDYLRQEALRPPSIEETIHKHKAIRVFIRKMLKAGIDYDQIPGTDGKTLLQPGSEKIAVWLRVRPIFDTVENDLGNGHIEVVVRAHMVPLVVYDLIMQVIEKGGADVDKAVNAIIRASELSNATASCSTMETNFRYRWADMRDEDGNPVKPNKLEASRKVAVNMGRWIPAKMAFGKIVPMTQKDKKAKMPAEYFIWQERVDNPNIHDTRNNVRQQGEKRCFVKAIKRMGALSEVFQEDPNEWPETLDVKPEPSEEPFVPGKVERNEPAPAAKPAEPAKPKLSISVVWQDKDLARVFGDTKAIEETLVRSFMGIKLAGKEEFIVQACYIPPLFELCTRENIQVQETQHKPKPVSPAAVEESGIIQNAKKSERGTTPNVQVLFNGAWLYCYSKTLWPFIFAGIKQQATLLVLRKEGRAPTIDGLRHVGNVRFGEDGKTVVAA